MPRYKSETFSTVLLVLLILIWFIYVILYKIVYRRIRREHVGPITKTPLMPLNTHSLTQVEGIDGIRFYITYQTKPTKTYLIQRLYSLILAAGCHDRIPHNIRVISIKMDGFIFGNLCHHFVPVNRQFQNGYFKYQMFGNDKIQAAFYVEDDVTYIAGICIYIEKYNEWYFDYRKEVIEHLMKFPKYIPRIQEIQEIPPIECTESTNIIDSIPSEKWNVQLCNRFERDLMTTSLNEVVYHKEWNSVVNQWVAQKCTDCSCDLDLPPSYDSIV